MVPTAEHQQVEDLGIGQFAGQSLPQYVVDARPIVQGITDVDQDTIPRARPAGIVDPP